MQRRTLLTAGGAAVVLGSSLTLTGSAWAQDAAPADAATTDAAPADAGMIPDMVIGAADAPVQMTEYASFTCPHCADFHATVWPQLKADYIDTGKVRFTYREVYFDRFGLWASMIARCGGEMRFFGITDLVYDTQRTWTASGDPATIAAELRKLGKTAGLTDAMLDECLNDAEMAQNLVTWFEANAEADDVTGTPSFLINGTKYSNMSYDEMKVILDEAAAG
ncbi:Protein-disulfide isomerase [Loktanella fryxellensis]|uniref:Protein-disulfide isomerase n=1 Tax=Loktanella fryxellensis TaxID=245187 RepID=A0A1H8HU60_9RHOB|nr:DsbA family protein [Loktanella fryxellensis]SEN59238.1 Protein-disulfide isomerase [Loktanella fryxellensis]